MRERERESQGTSVCIKLSSVVYITRETDRQTDRDRQRGESRAKGPAFVSISIISVVHDQRERDRD